MWAIHVFLQMPYRQMEGFVRKLATVIPGFKAADYTTFFLRIKDPDLSLPVKSWILAGDVIIAADSTGIRVTNRAEEHPVDRIFGDEIYALQVNTS